MYCPNERLPMYCESLKQNAEEPGELLSVPSDLCVTFSLVGTTFLLLPSVLELLPNSDPMHRRTMLGSGLVEAEIFLQEISLLQATTEGLPLFPV